MTKYTAGASALPYPEGKDKVAVPADIQALATATDLALSAEGVRAVATASKYTNGEVGRLQGRLAGMEELTSEPGTRLENRVIDPKPANAAQTWVGANASVQQATADWGRAVAVGGAAASVRGLTGLGSGAASRAAVYTGQTVAGRITLRAMDGQRMSATLNIVGYVWDGTAFTGRSFIATSGQLNIEPGAGNAVTFEAVGPTPAGTPLTHFELEFTFRRYGETYPTEGDYVYFRQAALYSGANAKSPVPYVDGDSGNSFWVGQPNASSSIRLIPRAPAEGQGAANRLLLDDFTYRRGGTKRIGPKTSISFRVDHGLANFNTKMRPKLESLGFKYALALGSRDWGAAENSGISSVTVNSWVAGGFAEVWSHSISHADADTKEKVLDYIVNSRKELEAAIPAARVDGYMPPGAGGTRYMGFGPIDSPEKFFGTLAGQAILQTYAVSTGEFPDTAYRVQDGTPRIGQSYFNMDTFDTPGIMSRVNAAIAAGRGIQLMLHPSLIDTTGYITTAQLHAALDQIKALQTAGKVLVMSAYDQLLADSSPVPQMQLTEDPADPGFFLIGA